MKEYAVQFRPQSGSKWINVKDWNPFKTADDARAFIENRQKEHPWNRYRIVVRTVTEWEEVI